MALLLSATRAGLIPLESVRTRYCIPQLVSRQITGFVLWTWLLIGQAVAASCCKATVPADNCVIETPATSTVLKVATSAGSILQPEAQSDPTRSDCCCSDPAQGASCVCGCSGEHGGHQSAPLPSRNTQPAPKYLAVATHPAEFTSLAGTQPLSQAARQEAHRAAIQLFLLNLSIRT